MKENSWYFIVNPEAGGGRVRKSWQKLENKLQASQIEFDFAVTQAPNHAYEIVENATKLGFRSFVVVGGDGSVNEAINGLMRQTNCSIEECVLSVIPWGTGNDWAAYYQLSAKVSECIKKLENKSAAVCDLGRVDYQKDGVAKTHWFVNFVGAGMDSYVLENMQGGGGSRLNYIKSALKGLLRYRSPQFVLSSQGQEKNLRSLMLMACNGKFGGAGMIFAPEAKTDDGLFNVLSIADMPVIKRVFSFVYLLTGKINSHPQVETQLSSELTISSDESIVFQCDGNLIGELPINVTCLPKKLNVIV